MRAARATAICLWALSLGGLGAAPGTALAGTYTVNSCAASDSRSTGAWIATVRPGQPIESRSFCSDTTAGGGDGAISFLGAEALRPVLPAPSGGPTTVTQGRVAGITLTAPEGSTLTHITYRRKLQSTDPSWDVSLSANGTPVDDCRAAAPDTPCADNAPGGVFSQDLPAGTTALDLAATCVTATCAYPSGSTYTFGAAIYTATVTVQDTAAPVITDLHSGTTASGWIGAYSNIEATATDAAGIKDMQLLEGSTTVLRATVPACVDWSPQPCADPAYGESSHLKSTFAVSTMKLADGPHTIVIRAIDAAGNVTDSAPFSVNVDATPPDAKITVGGTIAESQRSLSWPVPGSGAPLVSAKVEVCMRNNVTEAAPGCVTSDAPPAGPFTFDMPDPDSSAEVHVTLTDAAGNSKESGFVVNRDAVPPATPKLTPYGATGTTRTFVATTDDQTSEYANPSLCKGGTCTALKAVLVLGPATSITVTPPGPGDYRLDVTMSDAGGNASAPASATFTVGAAGANGVNAVVGAGTGSLLAAGASGKSIAIVPKLPKKLAGSTILIRGTVTPGSASLVSVTLAGRLKSGKAFGASKGVTPAANGAFALRLRLGSKLNRKKGVLLTIAATPTAGYALAKVRARLKG